MTLAAPRRTTQLARAGSAVAGMLLIAVTVSACSSSAHSTTSSPSTTIARATTTSSVPSRSAGCGAASVPRAGITQATIVSDGHQRSYLLDTPSSYDGHSAYAIVFGLHPLSVNYQFMPAVIGLADMHKRYRFIGVVPSGFTTPTPFWDAAPSTPNYDVDFIAHLLTHLEATLCIDPAQVFSTGISNGAQLSSLLGCRLSTRITAIAPVEGEEYLAPCTGRPEPILAFHGTADPILPYTGGGLNATRIAQLYAWHGVIPPNMPKPLGIDESMRLWAQHNKCDPKPVERRIARHVILRTWQHCAAATVLYIVQGGGHQWPGKPQPAFDAQFGPGTKEIDATTLMFHFFFDRQQ